MRGNRQVQLEDKMRMSASKAILRGLIFAILLSVLVYFLPAAMAQEAEQEEVGIEEVVVTARRREERLQEVPLSIAAFSAADIEAKSLVSLRDVGQFTTNFSFYNQGQAGNSGSVVYIRGIGQSDPNVFWDPGVGIYLDGVFMGRMQGIDLGLLDMERIEVLRGPQGTLFGKNTIGGAVSLVTTKPGDEFTGYAEVTAGNYDRIDGKFSVDIPITPGVFVMKLAGSSQNRDGFGKRLDWATGEQIDEMGDVDRLNGRAAFNWTPSENVGVQFSLDTAKIREFGAVREVIKFTEPPIAGLLNLFIDPQYSAENFATDSYSTSYASGSNANELDAWGAALVVDWGLGAMDLKSITSYRENEAYNGTDPDGSIYDLIDLIQDVDQDQFSQEFQLGGLSFDDKLDWVVGLYYFEEDAFSDEKLLVYRELLDFIGLDLSFQRRIWVNNKSYAAFGQGTYNVNEKLGLTGGLRYTYEKKDVGRDQLRQETGGILVPYDELDETYSAVSPRVSVDYKWSPDLMTYFSIAGGFKSGGINGTATSDAAFVPFDPEYVWTYELGLRSEAMDNRLRFNASFFYSDYEDIQFTVIRGDPDTGQPLTVIDNAAKATIKGFEMEVMAVPTPQLLLTAALGYIDAEYTDVEPGLPISTATQFVKTPEWSGTISAQYTFPLAGSSEIVGRVDWAYKSEIHHDQLNSPVGLQDSYGLLNARLSYTSNDNKWSLSLFGTNLTDERYIMAATDLSNTLAFGEVQWARPKEWGVSFRYNF